MHIVITHLKEALMANFYVNNLITRQIRVKYLKQSINFNTLYLFNVYFRTQQVWLDRYIFASPIYCCCLSHYFPDTPCILNIQSR